MVLYSYKCEECNLEINVMFDMGKAKKSVKCKKCGKKADRIFSCNTLIPDPVSDARINRGSG